jgi:hypothetical protein
LIDVFPYIYKVYNIGYPKLSSASVYPRQHDKLPLLNSSLNIETYKSGLSALGKGEQNKEKDEDKEDDGRNAL